MYKLRRLLKKIHTPITIMLVPHTRFSSRSLRVPFFVAVLFCCLSCVGFAYTASLTVQAFDYYRMKRQYAAISRQFNEMESTMASLKQSESQFRRLFNLGSRKEVLANLDVDESGSIDIDTLKKEITASMNTVQEIRTYLSKERDVFHATPQGWPATGRLTSGYGMREHPRYGVRKLHTGVDISVALGTPLHATADGVVSFADQSAGNGNVVVLEHGSGFSTVYAHNTKNLVHAGQTVKRGDVVAYSGSTGVSTGPHVHYEVWKNGRSVNPAPFLAGRD